MKLIECYDSIFREKYAMLNIDFWEHNLKAKKYEILSIVRNWLYEKEENTKGITLNDYITDKDIMFESQIFTQEWIGLNILSDWTNGVS